jgi:hypothetical protein
MVNRHRHGWIEILSISRQCISMRITQIQNDGQTMLFRVNIGKSYSERELTFQFRFTQSPSLNCKCTKWWRFWISEGLILFNYWSMKDWKYSSQEVCLILSFYQACNQEWSLLRTSENVMGSEVKWNELSQIVKVNYWFLDRQRLGVHQKVRHNSKFISHNFENRYTIDQFSLMNWTIRSKEHFNSLEIQNMRITAFSVFSKQRNRSLVWINAFWQRTIIYNWISSINVRKCDKSPSADISSHF